MNIDMTTLDFLDRAVDVYDDVTGVITHDGTEYSYAEFAERVNRVSNALLDSGIGEGDRVALLSPNTHYFLETLYGANQIGATPDRRDTRDVRSDELPPRSRGLRVHPLRL